MRLADCEMSSATPCSSAAPTGLSPPSARIELGPRIEALIEALGETLGGLATFDPGTARRRFRIACADPIASQIGPALVDAFRAEAPLSHFSARPAFLAQALRAVRRGEADVALGVFHQIPPGLVAATLFEDDYCVIARQGHPLVVNGRIDRSTYAETGHVFVGDPDGAFADEAPVDREEVDSTYGKLPGPNVIRTHAYVAFWETAMLIVAETDAMADCPRSLAARYAARLGLQVLDPPFRPFRFTVQAVRRANQPDPGLDWLMTRLAAAVDKK